MPGMLGMPDISGMLRMPGMLGMLGMPGSTDARDARDARYFRDARDARDARCFTLIRTHCHCKKKRSHQRTGTCGNWNAFHIHRWPDVVSATANYGRNSCRLSLSLSLSLSRNESKKRTQKKKKRKMSKKKSSDVLHRRPKRGQGFRVRWEIE